MNNYLPVMILKDLIILPNQEIKVETKKDDILVMISNKHHNGNLLLVCPRDTLEEEPSINDLPKVVTRLVCRSRFYKTNAETFLTMLNNIINDNPELPIFEASTVATINYISEWILTQVELR